MNGLQVIEYSQQRVLTTAQVAEAYATDGRRISENFTRNAQRYIHGTHFFALEGEAKRDFTDRTQIADGSRNASVLYLWTERGAFLHAKSLNTDEAWEMYERLLEFYFKKQVQIAPKTNAELVVEMAQQLLNQERQMSAQQNQLDELSVQLQVTSHRIDSLDNIDIIGDKQQRLNSMLRRYAGKSGVKHDATWKEFTQRYNTAYHTNLKALMDNYKERHGLRELTRPQYFSLVGQLDDAIRVADKMLNQVPVGVGE